MFIDGRRILVAGGSGLAGGGVVRALLAASASVAVRVARRGGPGLTFDDPRVETLTADLSLPADCRRAAAGCDALVMAAAFTAGAGATLAEPWRQISDNVVIDLRLLEACHLEGVRRIVHVGTASVYQEHEGAILEDDLAWDRDPPPAYLGAGWAKRYAEKACRFWHETAGLEILIARLANVFGPGARFDPRTSHFVAALVRKAVDRMEPFEVWGRPSVVRDILYADDFGRAVVAMLEATDIRFGIFNIGSGRPTSVGDVVDWALAAAGHVPARVVYRETGPATIAQRVLDCTRARTVLGWQPEVGAQEGVSRTVAWWRANRDTWLR